MRPFAAFAALALAVATPACHCSPGTPTAVTLRLNNASTNALWVDAGSLGMEVQRKIGGIFQTLGEVLPCACLACDKICGGCSDCQASSSGGYVEEVAPGMVVSRQWGGALESSTTGTCSGSNSGPATCFTEAIPDVDEVLNLHLCYAPTAQGVPSAVDAGVPVLGVLPPGNYNCTDKTFRVDDGVVEIGPVRGAACQNSADCHDPGELCFGGACTTACPDTGIPQIGQGWQVSIPDVSGSLFLATSSDGNGHTVSQGQAQLTAVQYSNGIMTAYLAQPDAGANPPTLVLRVALPQPFAEPLTGGIPVQVKIVDGSNSTTPQNRAVTLREPTGNLLLAADMAELGPLLAANDTSPFTVTPTHNVVGCDLNPCGKALHATTAFADGANAAEVTPGQASTLVVGSRAYRVLNVGNDSYSGTTTCPLTTLMPYAILYQPSP